MEADKREALDFMHAMRKAFGDFQFRVTVQSDGGEVVLQSPDYREPVKPQQRGAAPRLVRDALRVATDKGQKGP